MISLHSRHCSLTELEIIKASLRERTDHSYFYFRDPTHLQEQSDDLNTSQRALLMEIYESESEFAARKVKELKQQIIDTGKLVGSSTCAVTKSAVKRDARMPSYSILFKYLVLTG